MCARRRLLCLAACLVACQALVVPPAPRKLAQAMSRDASRPMVHPSKLVSAFLLTAAWPAHAESVEEWAATLHKQDFLAIGVLAFLLLFVIPSLASDAIETATNPKAANAKKAARLADLSKKYSFVKEDEPKPAMPDGEAAEAADPSGRKRKSYKELSPQARVLLGLSEDSPY
ncbi:hypothetical protein M885DRAFT_529551 [Pelagophyceae sp. CCMP2097]|nr:hypothetical protein M885DRAFT_529551 [Pelagophyceae sp. CCMP2097]